VPLPYSAERLLDDAVIVVVLRTDLVLAGRNTEQQHRLDPERTYPVDFLIQYLVNRELKHPRHRWDLALDCATVHHEERLDEIGWRKFVFADELPDGAGSASTSGSVAQWEGHKGRLESGRPARNTSQSLHAPWHVLCLYKEGRTREHVRTLSMRRNYNRKATGHRHRLNPQVNA